MEQFTAAIWQLHKHPRYKYKNRVETHTHTHTFVFVCVQIKIRLRFLYCLCTWALYSETGAELMFQQTNTHDIINIANIKV